MQSPPSAASCAVRVTALILFRSRASWILKNGLQHSLLGEHNLADCGAGLLNRRSFRLARPAPEAAAAHLRPVKKGTSLQLDDQILSILRRDQLDQRWHLSVLALKCRNQICSPGGANRWLARLGFPFVGIFPNYLSTMRQFFKNKLG
jgi:hypothetical protein